MSSLVSRLVEVCPVMLVHPGHTFLHQGFGGLLGETVQCIHVCGEDIDILDSFKYLGKFPMCL